MNPLMPHSNYNAVFTVIPGEGNVTLSMSKNGFGYPPEFALVETGASMTAKRGFRQILPFARGGAEGNGRESKSTPAPLS